MTQPRLYHARIIMDEKSINRINELARKKKSEGLTEEEQNEQKELYRQYIDEFKASLRTQLENTDVETPDGKIRTLSEFRKKDAE